MKFGSQIQFNAAPDLREAYVDYEKLKRLIYIIERVVRTQYTIVTTSIPRSCYPCTCRIIHIFASEDCWYPFECDEGQQLHGTMVCAIDALGVTCCMLCRRQGNTTHTIQYI